MQDKKLDDPSNQETTKESSLVCMIGDMPNEATVDKNNPKIMQTSDNSNATDSYRMSCDN